MIFIDIFTDRILTKQEILNGCSTLFKVNAASIQIVSDIEEANITKNTFVTCETFKVNSPIEFPFKMCLYYYNINAPEAIPENLKEFCSINNCRVLMPDDESIDSSDMVVINPDGTYASKFIDDIDLYEDVINYSIE